MERAKIWAHFQNDERAGPAAFNARPRYEYIAGHLDRHSKVLNIGVGRGGLESNPFEKGVDISCLDPDEKAISRIRQRLASGDKAVTGFAQALPCPSSVFDAVIVSEVLEHVDDDVLRATLEEVRRVLKPGGAFIGTVPAEENLLDNEVVCPHCGELFHRWEHVRSFTRAQLMAMLGERFGEVEVTRHYFADPRTLNWKGRLSRAAKCALMAIGIHGSDETFFFRAVRGA
ncbi:MAG: class I SAM-dependent methyltransferase [Burkholderiaceae bacterium]|nr:class I SAM-dependent methyltransferase [Burkholderiaceae bacterium]